MILKRDTGNVCNIVYGSVGLNVYAKIKSTVQYYAREQILDATYDPMADALDQLQDAYRWIMQERE